jgi:coronin-1B/1C/6
LTVQGGGGPFAVVPLNKPGRFSADLPIVGGHSGPVLDFDFNPFHDQILASASEDQTIKIWGIPEGGLTSNLIDPLVDLHGHAKKVTLLRFHPTASNVLASTSADLTVKLWDIEKGSEICSLDTEHDQLIQDVVWDYTGTTYTTSSKDKHVRIIDARSSSVVTTIDTAHEGAKSTKLTYTGALDLLITVGFTRQSLRQFKVWDPRNTSHELKKVDVDQAAGVIMPFFDNDTNLLYLAGKGDGNVRFYEIQSDTPYCFPLSEQRSAVSAKGMAWVPKRGLNVMGCETARLLKLTTNSVEPLSFFVPRKSEQFQEDLYPNTSSNEPSHTSDQWLAGSNRPPRLMSLNPSAKPGSIAQAPIANTPQVVVKTVSMLQRELDEALLRIKSLETQMARAGLTPK